MKTLLLETGASNRVTRQLRILFDKCPAFLVHAPCCRSRDQQAAALAEINPVLLCLISVSWSQRNTELIDSVLRKPQHSPAIVAVLQSQDTADAELALGAGADDYVVAPVRAADFLPRVRRLLSVNAIQCPSSSARPPGLEHIIGESEAFLAQLIKIPAAAASDAAVLISGETGTGKDIWARAIHNLSDRRQKQFLAVNCGGAAHLLENELFGHERGAFTGANQPALGKIQEAEGGTLFLDEINSMPLSEQIKILRVLEDKGFYRLGSSKLRTANVRIIAATNANLMEAMARGTFRRDLFHRLSVLTFDLPPLRAREGDVVLLARHFLRTEAARYKSMVRGFCDAALRKLIAHDWPGNVREVKHTIVQALHYARGKTLSPDDLKIPGAEIAMKEPLTTLGTRVKAEFEQRRIRELLLDTGGNISHAAQRALIARRTLQMLIHKYRINVTSPT